MRGEPGADRLHGRGAGRQRTALDEHAPDRRIGVAGLGRVGEPDDASVGEPYAGRALDVDEEGVDRVGEPDQFQPAPLERAGGDRRAVGIFAEAVRGLAGEAHGRVDAGWRVCLVEFDEIVRHRVERHRERRRAGQRPRNLRLVIAGEEAASAGRHDLVRPECRLEEGARLPVRQRVGKRGGARQRGRKRRGVDAEGTLFRRMFVRTAALRRNAAKAAAWSSRRQPGRSENASGRRRAGRSALPASVVSPI